RGKSLKIQSVWLTERKPLYARRVSTRSTRESCHSQLATSNFLHARATKHPISAIRLIQNHCIRAIGRQSQSAMDHDNNGADEGPPAKRLRSSEPPDATTLDASEAVHMNGHDAPMNDQDVVMEAQTVEDIGASASKGTTVVTPRKRGRPPRQTPTKSPATPSTSAPNTTYLTPLKAAGPNASTPGRNAADRSARRKTARTLLEHAAGDAPSDDDAGASDEDEDLARAIFGDTSDEDDEINDRLLSDGDGLMPDETTAVAAASTPTKQKRPRRKRAKSPTPPRDLPAQEMYFFHNKPGRPKTSDNTLAGLRLLTHDEYFDVLGRRSAATQRHAKDVEYLETLHAESFAQWALELAQGFSLCLYGFGSKRNLLKRFATHVHGLAPESPIVIVNGYTPTANIREILSCVARAVLPDTKKNLPSTQPLAMAQSILAHLSSASSSSSITILVHSIDSSALRRSSASSYPILASLAAHPAGVAFVLRSLPENAKNLFRLLVGEVLIAMDEDAGGGAEEGSTGVEYRMVYNKAVEEFVCSSEMAFRTLLKEFHDHQIITSRKDALGTELLSLPFRREELEAILEDLMA
ncbi:hypothetical protein LLEC1_05596, partial [Akanthomyces lecanii]